MPEFVNNIEQYIMEMTTSTNSQVPPSTMSSPLSPETALTIEHMELGHEVHISGTVHGVPIDAPLSRTHPCYQEACFKCHHLRHIHIHCQLYICLICKVNCSGHPQHCCPLNHCSPWPSFSLSSSSSLPCPILPPRSCRMGPENSIVCRHNPCFHSPPCSHSPLEDFKYDDIAIASMTGSPVSSFVDFWLIPFIRYPSPEFQM